MSAWDLASESTLERLTSKMPIRSSHAAAQGLTELRKLVNCKFGRPKLRRGSYPIQWARHV